MKLATDHKRVPSVPQGLPTSPRPGPGQALTGEQGATLAGRRLGSSETTTQATGDEKTQKPGLRRRISHPSGDQMALELCRPQTRYKGYSCLSSRISTWLYFKICCYFFHFPSFLLNFHVCPSVLQKQ